MADNIDNTSIASGASLDSCYFIIFMSNPLQDKVRAIVDGGEIKFTMKRQKFYELIRHLCGDNLVGQVYRACQDYGEFYILDRVGGSVKHLAPTFKNEKLCPTKVHKDIEARKHKDNFYEFAEQYLQSLQSTVEEGQNSSTYSGESITNANGYIDYSSK